MATLTEAEATAYRASVRESPAQMARWCLDNLGQRISAVGLDLGDASLLRRYARGDGKPSGDREGRLRLLYRIARMIADTFDTATARAFLRGSNPLLADHAPLTVIAEEGVATAGRHVVAAARAFLEESIGAGATSQAHYQVRNGKAVYDGRTLTEWVPEIVEAIVTASNPLQVILFGSVARGDHGPDSDIDLMVVLPSLEYAKRREWEAELGGAVSPRVPVQIFVTDERECHRRRDVIGSMHYWPTREGRVVYARAA